MAGRTLRRLVTFANTRDDALVVDRSRAHTPHAPEGAISGIDTHANARAQFLRLPALRIEFFSRSEITSATRIIV